MGSGELKSESIVIVDDDELVNNLVCQILQKEYRVESFMTAEEALASADLRATDVVITDINLPGIDGIEFLKRIQKAESSIPVILITGYSDIDVAIEALKNGAFDFILKPFRNDQITISVQKAVETRRLLIENRTLLEELRLKNQELETLNSRIQSRNVEIENELDIASNLQKCLFPVSLPSVRDFSFYLKFRPVEKISGDFFDFLVFGERLFSIIFADVSGHGVPAALYSAMVKAAILSVAEKRRDSRPSEFVEEINRFLISAQKKMSYNYVTLFYGLFDTEKKTLSYCNAGIPAPILIRESKELVHLEPNGPFVGIFNASEYRQAELPLESGDKLLFFTDGIFECTNAHDKIMGQRILIEMIQKLQHNDMKQMIEQLYTEVQHYCGELKPADDITLLGMSYSPEEGRHGKQHI